MNAINITSIVISGLVGIVIGFLLFLKIQKPVEYKCPDLKCPPAVQVQTLDLDKIKKIKGDFTYSPHYSGTVIFTDSCK